MIQALILGLNLQCLSGTDISTSILASRRLWREKSFINPESWRPAKGLFPFISDSWNFSGCSLGFSGPSARDDSLDKWLAQGTVLVAAPESTRGAPASPPPALKVHAVSREDERKTGEKRLVVPSEHSRWATVQWSLEHLLTENDEKQFQMQNCKIFCGCWWPQKLLVDLQKAHFWIV